MASLLEEGLAYKLNTLHNSKETIHRLMLDFNKYYENTAFAKKPIVSITKQDCEDFFSPLITTDRKKKDFDNIIEVANAIFDYAANRLEIIPINPIKKASLNRRILDKAISEKDEDRVYFHDEQDKLFNVIEKHLAEDDYALNLIEAVKGATKDFLSTEDYIFVDKAGRRHIRGLDNTLRDLCDEAQIPQKSFHDIRRTVASELHEQGMTLEDIRGVMGHKDIATTQGYIYSRNRRTDIAIAIHKAIKGNEANIFKAS